MQRLLAILITMTLSIPVLSGNTPDGGTESVFNLGAGARAMGMGNGYVALANDATAVYYNPAALPLLTSQQVSFLHAFLFEGTAYDVISYAYPISNRHAFGLAGMRVGTNDIGRRDAIGDIGTFGASQLQILLSYGRQVTNRASGGISLKLAHQSIDDMSAYGYGLDLAGHCQVSPRLRAGILLQDLIGARLKLDREKEQTPFTLRGGLAYQVLLDNSPFSGNVTLDMEKPEHRHVKLRSGLEISHTSGVSLRGGFDRDNVAMGLGVQYRQLAFDYAYKFINRLTDSHRFSLTLNFGATRSEIESRRAAQASESGRQYLSESRKQSLLRELELAERYYSVGKLDSSLAAYYRAEAFADDKAHIAQRITEISALLARKHREEASRSLIDTTGRSAMDLIGQIHRLYGRRAYLAARDLSSVTRRFDPSSAALDSLDKLISRAIDSIVADNMTKAESASSREDYISAYDAYNTVLLYQPTNKAAQDGSEQAEKSINVVQHLSLGLKYFNEEKYISSQREFRMALQLDPDNQIAAEFMGRIDERVKESTSLEDLQKDPIIWQSYLNGLEAFRQGDYQGAIKYWERVLEVYPNNRNTLENITQARLRLKP